MSVKSTVASTRSVSGICRSPVRNSSISPRIASVSPRNGSVSSPGSSTQPGAGDVLGQVAHVAHVEAAVARAVQQQRGDADRAEHVADVEVAVELGVGGGVARAHAQALEAAEPLGRSAVVRRSEGAKIAAANSPSPQCSSEDVHRLVALLGACARTCSPRPAWCARRSRRATSDSTRSGMLAAASMAIGPPSMIANSDRPLGAGGVQHGAHVVDLLLERRRPRAAVGHARAAAVEEDQPAERGQPVEEAGDGGVLPEGLDRGEGLRDVHEVARAVADHLVGDRHTVAGLGVPCAGRHRAGAYVRTGARRTQVPRSLGSGPPTLREVGTVR